MPVYRKIVIAFVLFGVMLLLPINTYMIKGSTDITYGDPVSVRLVNNTTPLNNLRDNVGKFNYSRLGDHRTYGIADDHSVIGYEGLFGVLIEIKGKQAHVRYYNHLGKQPAAIRAVNRDAKTTFFQADKVQVNDKVIIDLKRATDYDVDIYFENEYEEGYGSITLIDGEWYTYIKKNQSDYRDVDIYTRNLKSPENYLDLTDIVYPGDGYEGDVNEVKDWERVSDELIYDRNISDQFKVYIFTRYLRNNYAYDKWKCDVKQSRAAKANVWSDPKLFMFHTKVGVCWDFTNVLAIMCRHQGIPATSIDSDEDNHTINAIYVDDQWIIIDMTRLLKYYCTSEEPNTDNWESYPNYYMRCYSSYGCACDYSKWALDHYIWTNESVRNRSSHKDIYNFNDELDKYRKERDYK